MAWALRRRDPSLPVGTTLKMVDLSSAISVRPHA
eukprot:CAMPEP_0114368650 /NCGR_PEP_ID=MMETSP0101-20121206/31022_1 /TAXON_ID=38822 ORGANISM="Pteridomonas danica, Strain PT" /NCGR_SAMPLE_ID=MMETSP0101 /ASSEMBLY_ACC=CAM_ASM_000211 /LENGTH=33 /DNA_ID= /DNA_START= /DNA_END= /DNA_ORIENTATION=